MMTAKVIEDEQGQVVYFPEECRFQTDEVLVDKIGDAVILKPKVDQWASFASAIDLFSDDYMKEGR